MSFKRKIIASKRKLSNNYINFVISDNVECVLIFVLFVAIGPSIAADLSPARENLSRKSAFRQDSKIPCCAAQTHLTFSVPELLCERRKAQSQACLTNQKSDGLTLQLL